MSTVLAADCAFPFDYSRLPHGVSVIMGYTGQPGCTPHVWTPDEVRAAQATGRTWVPIHTPPQGELARDAGKWAANLMVEELKRYPIRKDTPCFLDIERASWDANPAVARACVADWQAGMHAAGHPQSWAYLPSIAETQWVADWVGQAPQHFAPGVIGVQYAGNVDHGRYDLSVFAASVFATSTTTTTGETMTLNATDKAWVVGELETVQRNVQHMLQAINWDNDKAHPQPHALAHLDSKLDELLTAAHNGAPGGVDVHALATELARVLGPVLGTDVVVSLGKALVR